MNKIELLEGTLLGDASIQKQETPHGDYFYYKLTAKDEKLLEHYRKLFGKYGIKNTYIVQDNKSQGTFSLGFYMNKHSKLPGLKQKWYKERNGKTLKVVPENLKLTSTVLLHWHLGDGSVPRRKEKNNMVPPVVLAANCFSEEGVELLIRKLKELGLNFYPVEYRSGFKNGKRSGECLYSCVQDDTLFRYFSLIGVNPPSEIKNCTTGRKGKGSETHYFKDKWPTRRDWLKILSNTSKVGEIFKKKRGELDYTQKEVAEKVGISREHIRDVENCKRHASVPIFKKILDVFNFSSLNLLEKRLELS
ncbi:hypothetical protein AKJ51_03270 [candidate division MSBL1 archaeon SCGC-AAA382A20]|uniref:HTH cro/C1-type domain-containing protein n=1 Tax=candidate division MSBL1 archaeon SCGC-AAA382A20 TaxID=1698280 RepID=A0A133VJQ0_9EURY|nr:hypothetical protein AKJ51_03270 [candidate division MSBL1 archaeon SCGC-AAA382A20]